MGADVAEHELVAVGRRLGDAGGAGHAARAAHIFNDDLLPQKPGKAGARMRATVSAGPPAANGTTMVTGRVGQSWDSAGPRLRTASATTTNRISRAIQFPKPKW